MNGYLNCLFGFYDVSHVRLPHIFKIKQSYSLVQATQRQTYRSIRQAAESSQNQKHIDTLQFRIQSFLSSFTDYVYDVAIRENFDVFLQDLCTSASAEQTETDTETKVRRVTPRLGDIFEVGKRHSSVLDRIMTACLLRGPQKGMFARLEVCLGCVVRLGVLVGVTRGDSGDEMKRELEELGKTFESGMIDFVGGCPLLRAFGSVTFLCMCSLPGFSPPEKKFERQRRTCEWHRY